MFLLTDNERCETIVLQINNGKEVRMSYMADAHRQWHTAHGWNMVCPLDCGVTERYDDYYDEEEGEPLVKCGKCKGRHAGARGVAVCHGFAA